MDTVKIPISNIGDYCLKAVIIAGGFGTRLRPVSCTRPKHLFPIAGKPLLDWTFERLTKNGVNETVFAVNHMSEAFVKRYGKSTNSMKIHYAHESKPLGTGGCVKNAEKIIGRNENFLLLNGDIISNIDYAHLMNQHAKNRCTATITLHRVNDPSRYGVVELAKHNRIKRFIEKPPRENAPSNMINAGAYALSPKIFDYIPSGKRVSIEHEVFPTLAEDNELFGYEFEGLWIDVGEPSDFLEGNRLLLDSELQNGQIAKSARVKSNAKISNPVAVGAHTKIGDRSMVGPHVTLGDYVVVGRNVRIRNSVVFSGTVISDFSSIEGAIIGEQVSIGKQVKMKDNVMIGDQAIIHDGVKLASGVAVCPYKEVTESTRITKCFV